MTESFLRQRRNLFIVNGILLFAFYAKVNISKFTLAGISFSGFENPAAIYYFLWIIFAYFFYRFSLFFIEDEMSNFYLKWTHIISSSADQKLKELAYNHSGKGFNENSMLGYYNVKRNNWTLHYQVEEGQDNFGEINIVNMELAVPPLKLLLPQLRAVTKFCFLTSNLTNYLLPVILSIFTVIVVGLSPWEGSILKIFT